MTITMTRERYLDERLKKGRAQIAREMGVPYSELLKQLSRWGYKNLEEEQDLLERMRAARGLPSRSTRGPQPAGAASRPAAQAVSNDRGATSDMPLATESKTSTNSNAPKPAIVTESGTDNAPTVDEPAEILRDFTVDLSKVDWVAPVTRKLVELRFTRAGIRISNPLAKRLSGVRFVAIGFMEQTCVIKPASQGWKVKSDGRCDGYIVGSRRIVELAQKSGFAFDGALTGQWVTGDVLVLRPKQTESRGVVHESSR